MRKLLDFEFILVVRSNDPVVVDAPSLNEHAGTFMAKADGIKTYIFGYTFGYIVTVTDPALPAVSCVVSCNCSDLPEITSTPDVIIAEMMMNGNLVFTSLPAVDGRIDCLDPEYGREPDRHHRYALVGGGTKTSYYATWMNVEATTTK
ncbi:hypothetical protein MKZ38_005452 [Zalerion maritima]|uniref:Uncharacterized protein n=1 Tax=Zalerion maritima TaxID=339359 RepID=A0AAD5RK91_9PEZI|nr:hypothetical protein MKZ38_005452 [Zalerion maritima]